MEVLSEMEYLFLTLLRALSEEQRSDVLRVMKALQQTLD